MVMLLGEMQLPVTEDPDPVRTYLNGTAPSGGLWTALGRASDHDHTGGLNGKQLNIAAIPDGSITTGKLDPSVLLPYALVDGSKPFTGQVTMASDAIIRDTLYFGEQGTALPPDTFWQRAGVNALRTDSNVGLGVSPAAWGSGWKSITLGNTGAISGTTGTFQQVHITSNSYTDDTGSRAIAAGAGSRLGIDGSGFYFYTAPSVSAGAVQAMTSRLTVAPDGMTRTQSTDTITNLIVGGHPNVPTAWASGVSSVLVGQTMTLYEISTYGQWGSNTYNAAAADRAIINAAGSKLYQQAGALVWLNCPAVAPGATQTMVQRFKVDGNGTVFLTPAGGSSALVGTANLALHAAGGRLLLSASSQIVGPSADAYYYSGYSDARWHSVWSQTGTIQTSHIDAKENIAALSPSACVEAVLGTQWWEFDYKPFGQMDGQEDAAYQAYLTESAPVRHQRGYVLGSPDHRTSGLFGMGDRKSASPQTDLAVVACALQQALQRIAALEARAN